MSEEWKLTEHIRFLTEGMEMDHYIIMDLKQELQLARSIMTDEQMQELRELLLKAQQRKQGETK
jgi:chemotaxis protein CheY-P-specific phosphatase CheC